MNSTLKLIAALSLSRSQRERIHQISPILQRLETTLQLIAAGKVAVPELTFEIGHQHGEEFGGIPDEVFLKEQGLQVDAGMFAHLLREQISQLELLIMRIANEPAEGQSARLILLAAQATARFRERLLNPPMMNAAEDPKDGEIKRLKYEADGLVKRLDDKHIDLSTALKANLLLQDQIKELKKEVNLAKGKGKK